jgi:hypothetical protein
MKGHWATRLIVGAAAVILLLTACTLPTPGIGLSNVSSKAQIYYPLDGNSVVFGDQVEIRAVVDDPRGVAWVQLWVDGRPEGEAAIPELPEVTHFVRDLLWTPQQVGEHEVKIIALNGAGQELASDPIRLYVSDDPTLKAAVMARQLTQTPPLFVPSTPLPVFSPTPKPTATPTPTSTATPVPCSNNAAFVADITVPDNTVFKKRDTFNKTWQLNNTGTCTWDLHYEFVFVDGERMEGASPTGLPKKVPPGDTVEVTVSMIAPDEYGTFRGRWQMRSPDDENFGSIVDVLIEVEPGPDDLPVINRFEVVPGVINQGQSATVYWEYTNGTFARLTPGGEGGVGSSGSLVVSPSGTTSYRLVVSNGAGAVERSYTLIVQSAPTPSLPPAAPTDLVITDVRSDGFDFSWTDNSTNEEGFRLLDADTRQILATFSVNASSGTVSELDCETSYRFILVAFNQDGDSFSSNTVQGTTATCGE